MIAAAAGAAPAGPSHSCRDGPHEYGHRTICTRSGIDRLARIGRWFGWERWPIAAGAHGLVCSASEITPLRSSAAQETQLVVPGIRPVGYGARRSATYRYGRRSHPASELTCWSLAGLITRGRRSGSGRTRVAGRDDCGAKSVGESVFPRKKNPVPKHRSSWTFRSKLRLLQAFEEIAGRAGDVDATGRAALAILHALYDACRLAALRAVGALGGVHCFLAVTGFGNLCHDVVPPLAAPSVRLFGIVIREWAAFAGCGTGLQAVHGETAGFIAQQSRLYIRP